MVKIEFFGAAKTVTGSHYVITGDNFKFAIDCGMFQGPDVENLNLKEFQYNPSDLNFALLTHAHIDHSGMFPKLVKNGFTGNIYATNHTIQISSELLMDSAKLQENAFQRGEFYGRHTQVKAIVYNTFDASKTIEKFKAVRLDEEFSPIPEVTVKFIKAGHILGAASIELSILDNGETKKFIFSGDIGRVKTHIDSSFDFEYSSNPNYIIMESLYGGKTHPDRDESAKELVKIINETIKRKGNVYIPSFAVQRTQEILNDLRLAKESKELSQDLPVWVDSPLAQRVTGIYTSALQSTQESLFDFPNLNYVKKFKQSVGLTKKEGQVIIAGSGMADGGRIVHHLQTALLNKKNSVIFVGFQAEETAGRALVEKQKSVNLDGKNIGVKAEIYWLQGFSAHGDTNDYQLWINRFKTQSLKKIFLIHAEEERALALKTQLENNGFPECEIPEMNSSVII